MNHLLEDRLDSLRTALDALAAVEDEKLKAILFRLSFNNTPNHRPVISIDALAKTARERCMFFMARANPFANDLKYAMAALRVGQDYERIDELVESIAKRLDRLAGTPVEPVCKDMKEIVEHILAMHQLIRESWQRVKPTADLKLNLVRMSTQIHDDIVRIQNRVVEIIAAGSTSANHFVELVLACRHLKRIANLMEGIPGELNAFG